MSPQIIMKPNATGSGKRDDEIHIVCGFASLVSHISTFFLEYSIRDTMERSKTPRDTGTRRILQQVGELRDPYRSDCSLRSTHKDILPSGTVTMTDIERDEKYGWIGIQSGFRSIFLELVTTTTQSGQNMVSPGAASC